MFGRLPNTNKAASVIEDAKQSREQRLKDRERTDAAIRIQSFVRRCLCIKHLRSDFQKDFEKTFASLPSRSGNELSIPAEEAFGILRHYFFLFNFRDDRSSFRTVCEYLNLSIASEKPNLNFMTILQWPESVAVWRRQVMFILKICSRYLSLCEPKRSEDSTDIVTFCQTIVMLTHPSQWKAVKIPNEKVMTIMNNMTTRWMKELVSFGLYGFLADVLMNGLSCSNRTLTSRTFFPLLTVVLRPLALNAFENLPEKRGALLRILMVPAFLHHVEIICPSFIDTFRSQGVFRDIFASLAEIQAWSFMKDAIKSPDSCVALVGNLAHLFWLEKDAEYMNSIMVLQIVSTMIFLLDRCKELNETQQGQTSKYHPIFGWSNARGESRYHDAMKYIKLQLQFIWRRDIVKKVFQPMETRVEALGVKAAEPKEEKPENKAAAFLQKLGLSHAKSTSRLKLADETVGKLAIVCAMYQTLINCLGKFKLEIITGLCLEGHLPSALWKLIDEIGVQQFLQSLKPSPNTYLTEFQLLALFCNLSAHLITIMDDVELFDEHRVFKIKELADMAQFCNEFVFRIIWDGIMTPEQMKNDPVFSAAHRLLQLLHQRDSRHGFVPPQQWIMKEAKGSNFFDELKDDLVTVQLLLAYAPHCVPHNDRVKLFRKKIKDDKFAQGDSKVPYLIPIHRKRIVEDGFEHISALAPKQLRGCIRIRFINEQGIAEAGIDQDGVFKEFLEEIIKRIFNPNLHLFQTTIDHRLYPSPTSFIQENHLQYFVFVGRMLGKAVYEGIVVDVPFANFFLSQVLGQTSSSSYSYVDELPSFDPELSRTLSSVKRYEGNVEELGLAFTCNEDRLGQLVTHELIPGGSLMDVTDENKILYVHLMAYFRMHGQIKPQVNAFIQGFYSIVKPEWLAIFSPPELQKLISGDSQAIDLKDLRKHTHYYGGFHGSHRVITWLWNILEQDFNEEERRLFLKFVTSCSKPPLLGFAHLDPPFSIRCVDVGEDMDSGDTIGSVIRGFFTVGRKKVTSDRLPTASTCFNLLKLPNYQKKSVLREKLLYAIKSNSGFELS